MNPAPPIEGGRPRARGRHPRERGPAPRTIRPGRVLDLLLHVSEVLDTVVDPEVAGWSVLVAFTAGEGLGFNRAFLLLAEGEELRGWFGVGPRTRDEARKVWTEMRGAGVLPLSRLREPDHAAIESEQRRHAATLAALSHAHSPECNSWRRAFIGRPNHPSACVRHWSAALESRDLAVVPLMAPGRPWGVVLADNFVTHAPIHRATLEAAETLAHYLRAALERTQLLQRLQGERRQRIVAEHATALLETARTLAHDLKNPLALAGGLARELVAAPPADRETLMRQLGIVAGAVSRAEQRVGELVEGLANRADGIALEPVEVGGLTDRVAAAFRPLAASRGVRLLCYHPARPVVAAAAAASLERCVENLIANAVEALSDRGGEVHVAAREEAPWVRIEVADNGQPLPAALRADPFAGGVTTHRGGSGLGLRSVRTLAEAMGGRVEYDEREPGWARFTVVLRRWS
ncbi:MAG: HAMP domain-containing sensor histidine kinase [Thermoanaerobaculaceae bacterium]|nr:HAMP domain-containing sensor histidine kinase [Thermoanaerobaculaceae bacterium]